MSEYEKNGKQD